jgi:hypothetical protein
MTSAFLDSPPDGPSMTDYDRAHIKLYLRLLDADAAGAGWREVAPILFGLDVEAHPDRAERIHAAHLARARWMTTNAPGELVGHPPR